jgi:outer membrane protein assembly factor BamB
MEVQARPVRAKLEIRKHMAGAVWRPQQYDSTVRIPGGFGRLTVVALGTFVLVPAAIGALFETVRVAAASVPADAAPWPMALSDARHAGTSSATGPVTGHVEWTRDLGSNITPGPVVGADGTIYVASNAGVLHALDPSTGADRWTFAGQGTSLGPSDLSTSPLVLSAGDVLWPGPGNALYLLSSSGQLLWRHSFDSALTSPVQSGSDVYVGTTGGNLMALDVSGPVPQVRWQLSVGRSSYGSPVVAPDGEVVTTADNRLVTVRDQGTKGTVAWHRTFKGAVEVSAAVGADGTVVVGTNDRYEYAFTPSGGLKWRVLRGTQSYSSPSVSPDGNTYFGGNTGKLQVVRTSTGRAVTTDKGMQGLWAAQVVDAQGNVYFGTQGAQVYGYSPSGNLLFDLPVSGPIDGYPAMTAGGALIVGDEKGTLYAIGG